MAQPVVAGVDVPRGAEPQGEALRGGVAVEQVYVDPGAWEVGIVAEAEQVFAEPGVKAPQVEAGAQGVPPELRGREGLTGPEVQQVFQLQFVVVEVGIIFPLLPSFR